MVQLNTPYPATAYLTGFLRQHQARLGLKVRQADPALDLFLRLFSRAGLKEAIGVMAARRRRSPAATHLVAHRDAYLDTIDAVVRFLQRPSSGPGMAQRIAARTFLPEGPRFLALAEERLREAFGALGIEERARHLASLYLDDVADAIGGGVDDRFQLSRYAEKLAMSAPTFDPLARALERRPTLIDRMLDDIAGALAAWRPDLVGVTVPFPGNLYGALRLARALRRAYPEARVVLGGGYVNTELRSLAEPRLFDYVDFVTLDDGERPLLALIEHLGDASRPLLRTFARSGDRVVYRTDPTLPDVPMRDTGTPTYDGLPLDRYLSLLEMLNPMHRLWSEGRWNKLTVARGCYWKKCTFCDLSLDYIARYDPAAADLTCDRIEALIAETGDRGFHFVDEAAPPKSLHALAERLLARKIVCSWWGNIRFEKTFTPALARLLHRSGCIALSGGLEVASDRLLERMQKGVTVAQVARVTRALTDAGILVHAYLMYGFPTETAQETIDSLERVRQLFAAGCLSSAFWHRFAATAHSPIGKAPGKYQIRILPGPPSTFARNELPHQDPSGCDHDRYGPGLERALYNYMHGVGLDLDVREWFGPFGDEDDPPAAPRTTVAPDFVKKALSGSMKGAVGAGAPRRSACLIDPD
jgi:radical SAM superfamily enzyme YgiQ (UPF0313 family)